MIAYLLMTFCFFHLECKMIYQPTKEKEEPKIWANIEELLGIGQEEMSLLGWKRESSGLRRKEGGREPELYRRAPA